MVCIVCFDVVAIIRFFKCDRYLHEVIKLFKYSVVTLDAENYLKIFIWLSLWLEISQGIMI